jgi:cytochrome b involved in lipid metabolism
MNNLALYNKIFQKKNLLQWNGKKIFFQKYNLLLKNKNKRFYYLKSFPFLKNSYQNFSNDNLFNKKNINSSNIIRKIFLGVSFGVLALGILIQKAIAEEKDRTLEEDEKAVEEAGKFIEGLPVYSKSEVAKHNNPETGIWVTFKNGVYDITEFIEFHPGHDKILLASGAAVEPFWAFYSQHYTANVVELLEQYRIGNLSNEDAQSNSENIQDAYFNDPERPPYFIIRQKKNHLMQKLLLIF